MSKNSDAKIFSVIGGCRRSGRWLVPAKTSMLTLFGRAIIDLRQAEASADEAEELEFTCTSVFANITFIVPEGAEVRPSGMAILGSSRSVVPVSDEPCELPPISIDALTVFGRMRVRTTDSDPEAKHKKRRFRRDKPPEVISVPAPAAEEAPALPEPSGVDLAPSRPNPEVVAPAVAPAPVVVAAPVVTAAPVAATPVVTAAPIVSAAPADLSRPIEAFAPAETSPLESVTVPETIEGAVAALPIAAPAPAPAPQPSVQLPEQAAAPAVQLPAEQPVQAAQPVAPAEAPQVQAAPTEAQAAPAAPAEAPQVQAAPAEAQAAPAAPTEAAAEVAPVEEEPEEDTGPPPVHLPVEGELLGSGS